MGLDDFVFTLFCHPSIFDEAISRSHDQGCYVCCTVLLKRGQEQREELGAQGQTPLCLCAASATVHRVRVRASDEKRCEITPLYLLSAAKERQKEAQRGRTTNLDLMARQPSISLQLANCTWMRPNISRLGSHVALVGSRVAFYRASVTRIMFVVAGMLVGQQHVPSSFLFSGITRTLRILALPSLHCKSNGSSECIVSSEDTAVALVISRRAMHVYCMWLFSSSRVARSGWIRWTLSRCQFIQVYHTIQALGSLYLCPDGTMHKRFLGGKFSYCFIMDACVFHKTRPTPEVPPTAGAERLFWFCHVLPLCRSRLCLGCISNNYCCDSLMCVFNCVEM